MWSRFIYWLGQGQNAGAVQAIAALSAVALTVVLIIITAVYAYFTWHLLRTSREGLKATVRPQFTVSLTTELVDKNSMDVVTTIQNVGNMSFTVRLVMVRIECAYYRRAGYVSNQYLSGPVLEQILAPQEETSTPYRTLLGERIYHHGSASHSNYPCKPEYSAVINVEDLQGNVGWFRYDPNAGLSRDPRFDSKGRRQKLTQS
jgi:hypothetical protein